MNKFAIACGLAIAAVVMPGRAFAASFTQLVVYGDSLSDLGRAFDATGGAVPPYGNSTGGRFSNGPLWVEYLASQLGVANNPNTNFAVGGATTGTANTIANELNANNVPIAKPSQLVGIEQQVNGNSISDPNALYIIWGGANDYLGGNIIDPNIPIGRLASEISTLINGGAKNILVPNLPNLGALPGTQANPNAANLNLLSQGHNAQLALAIAGLSQANPDVKLTVLDVNNLFNQAVNNPSQFGLSNVTDGCVLVNCQAPNSYLFWDQIHPTTAAHQLIGNLSVNAIGATPVPEPFTIVGTIVGSAAVLRLRKKLKSTNRAA
jgi:thermolabile hemolysin